MKKVSIILPAALSLLCGTVHAQNFTLDADVIARLDMGGCFPFENTEQETFFTADNSGLYTNLEATFGKHFGFTWVGHWLASSALSYPFDYTKYLYQFTGRSNYASWTDYAHLSAFFGNWTIHLGKDCLALGGWEYDEWDWDCSLQTTSIFWLNFNAYQWGGSVSWLTPSEKTELTLQASSSPYTDRPWQQGIGAYSIRHYGCYGPIETRNSISFLQNKAAGNPDEKAGGTLAYFLGVKGNIGECASIGAEWHNRWDTSVKLNSTSDFFSQSNHVMLFAEYFPIEKVGIKVSGSYERLTAAENFLFYSEEGSVEEDFPAFEKWTGGITVSYYPLQGRKDLRVQTTLAANSQMKAVSGSIGITYNPHFHFEK